MAQPSTGDVRVERRHVAGGAELTTVFWQLPDRPELPVVAFLNDTLGDQDPSNDRLRYVWILTQAQPSVTQRIASFLPFFYWRPFGRGDGTLPSPVLDMASPAKTSLNDLTQRIVQWRTLNGRGIFVRAPSRSYRGNGAEYRLIQTAQAIAVLSRVEGQIPASQLEAVQARLMLDSKFLGGFVSEGHLSQTYARQTSQSKMERGHNWELLRQRAESNSLYFQPLMLRESTASHAMLWVSRDDLTGVDRPFDARFLGIANPWTDEKLRSWKGYSETWTLAQSKVEMIPLALYSLDHPRVPLLLIDFRSELRPKNREVMLRAADDVTAGILGITGYGNWSYMAARTSWDFVQTRRGAALNRAARIRAYAQFRHLLSVDRSLPPKMRKELEDRIDHLALNPLEQGFEAESKLAHQQYAALLEYTRSGNGLGAQLDADRRAEIRPLVQGRGERAMYRTLSIASLGMYRHEDTPDIRMLERLNQKRQLAWHSNFLDTVLASGARPEVVWDMERVRRSVGELAALSGGALEHGGAGQTLVTRLFAQTRDESTRRACLNALRSMEAKEELARLLQDPSAPVSLREPKTAAVTEDLSARTTSGGGQ